MKIQRVQTGVRIEKRMLKVLKALAEYLDMSLGDLLEAIVLYAFEGKSPFVDSTREKIEQLKVVYGMDYGSEWSHRMVEGAESESGAWPRIRPRLGAQRHANADLGRALRDR